VSRTAHPYRDLDVIDSRAPRVNQAFIGSLAFVAVTTGWWPLLTVAGLQLAVGLTLGRRWCLPCLAYFELIQPRTGEGPLEDARAPRFANMMGLAVLGTATVAYLAGVDAVGLGLGALVAALALLAAVTGFCTGCEIYRLGARLRGIGHGELRRIDLADLGEPDGDVVVHFTHPLCADCHVVERRLRDDGRRLVTVDVRRRPDLARKYGIGIVPTAVAVAADGAVWCGGEGGQIYRIADGTIEQVATTGGFCLGMAFDADGMLYVCDLHHAAVFRLDTRTGALDRFADGAGGHRFVTPNAIAIDARGHLIVTDSGTPHQPRAGLVGLRPDEPASCGPTSR
jgi:hypothetical protein